MRKVLGAQTEEPPLRGVHRLQPELVLQKKILVAQTGEVAFVECIFLVVLGNHIELQQTGLSHEESLNLEQVVAVMADGLQRDSRRPCLEGITVDAESVVAG